MLKCSRFVPKILITGVMGTLGRPLKRELEARGHDVWGLDLQDQAEQKYYRADLQPVVPVEYSEEAFKRLSELRVQPHPTHTPLAISTEKAKELAKEVDSVPSAYIDSLAVFYDPAYRTFWFEGPSGAEYRFRQIAGEIYPDASDAALNLVQLLWANSTSRNIKGEHIKLWDVFRTVGTLLREYAAQPGIIPSTSLRSTEQEQLQVKKSLPAITGREADEGRVTNPHREPVISDDDFSITGRSGVLKREQLSPDSDPLEAFRSFSYGGTGYSLTKGEGQRVQILWKRFKSGNAKVLKSALACEAYEFKAAKVFDSPDGKRFRKDFIRNDKSGKYWLEVP
jgi:hypothetical protein